MDANHIALPVEDTEGVTLPLDMYRRVYFTFTGVGASATAVVIDVAGVLYISLGRIIAECSHA